MQPAQLRPTSSGAHNSLNGRPHLVPGDPGRIAFMDIAIQLEHPMNARPPLDADLRYAIQSVWQLQRDCPVWRVAQMKQFAAAARRLQATSSVCHRAMATTVRRLSGEFNVGLAAP